MGFSTACDPFRILAIENNSNKAIVYKKYIPVATRMSNVDADTLILNNIKLIGYTDSIMPGENTILESCICSKLDLNGHYYKIIYKNDTIIYNGDKIKKASRKKHSIYTLKFK
jgi:hypothetical protein